MRSAARFVFGAFEIDAGRRRLIRAGEPLAVSDRQLDVLLLLVGRAGHIVSKDELIQAGWKDVAVGDNSLEQAISALRRTLGAQANGTTYIETVARRGYRLVAAVERQAVRESDAALDALLAPYRAFVEGRVALETLERGHVAHARSVFDRALASAPDHASAHIGLANAAVMQFEMTRADPAPDAAALSLAVHHAREACRLDAESGEAWATLGFVLSRAGQPLDAQAASKRAVALEPDTWRHLLRLAFVSWGEERLRAAHRTLALLPGLPLAHWLAATIYVARRLLPEAERELRAGVSAEAAASASPFGAIALHWLLGLLHLQRGEESLALEAFERELLNEPGGHLYARECCANTWYAIGALRLSQRRPADAAAAFQQALARIAEHPLARVGLAAAGAVAPQEAAQQSATGADAALARAASLVAAGARDQAARTIEAFLSSAPAGNALWLLPVEPLLRVSDHPAAWARALARLKSRAS